MYIRGEDNIIYETHDIFFADDLTTFSPTIQSMQRKADVVGAFCQVFRLQISVKKLRQNAEDYGREHIIPDDSEVIIDDGKMQKTYN